MSKKKNNWVMINMCVLCVSLCVFRVVLCALHVYIEYDLKFASYYCYYLFDKDFKFCKRTIRINCIFLNFLKCCSNNID